ncbi:hypothetical protein B0H14DRAFT_2629585 [Mycena olivaceomarginata]|nr:hypothetical protein B0H14DRAFT_2629585 [Mycena olivaceomarginata]
MAASRKRTRIEDSDDESQSDRESPSPTRSPPSCGMIFLSIKAARLQQQKANDARKELRAAQRQIADITNQDDTAPKRGRKKRKMVHGGSDEETKEVKNLAHKFTMMKLLWIPDFKKTANTKVDDQYNPLERFENAASKGGVLPFFWGINDVQFHVAMGTQRSNAAGRVRRECGPEIFDCTTADLSTSESRRDKFRKQIGYVEDAEGKSHYEAFNVDLLHKDYNGSFDIKTVFRGAALHLAFAGLTRGPKAVTAMKTADKPIQATGKCSPNFGTLITVLPAALPQPVRWAASADTEPTPRGAETGINWQADFEKYIAYLQNGLDKRKASVLKIFHCSLAATEGGEDHADKDVMDLLNADEEEVPEGAE